MATSPPAEQLDIQLPPRMAEILEARLPAVTGTHKLLLKKIERGVLSFRVMSDQIKNDPILALQLLSRANMAIRSDESLVATLTQALSLLGENFLIEQLKRIPDPAPLNTARGAAFQKAVMASFFAAKLTRQLASQRFSGREEELFWAALFWGAPFWYLAYHEPTAFTELWQSTATWNKASQRFADQVGFTPEAFWKGAQHRFKLPDMIQQAWNPVDFALKRRMVMLNRLTPTHTSTIPIENRELKLWAHNPGQLLMLCNQAAFLAGRDWHDTTFLTIGRQLAAMLQLPLQSVIHTSHQAVVNALHLHPLPGGLPLVMGLFCDPMVAPLITQAAVPVEAVIPSEPLEIPDDPPPIAQQKPAPEPALDLPVAEAPASEVREIESTQAAAAAPEDDRILVRTPKPAPAPQDTTIVSRQPKIPVPAAEPAARRGDKALFNQICENMMRNPGSFRDMPHLMNMAARCLVSGAGLQVGAVMLCNQDQTLLKTYFFQGGQDRPALQTLQLDIKSAPLLQKLMAKQSSLWVRPETAAKLKGQFPEELLSASRTLDFFLMSCFAKTRPIALIYADGGSGKTHLTDFEYESFKQACSGVTQVLYYLAQQRAKAQKK